MKTYLRRYTELPFVVDFLQTKTLTLLRPISWDDKNDAYYIDQYAQQRCLKAVFVLCLAESAETYHHWSVFSKGTGGACIEFHKDVLIEAAQMVHGLRAGSVQYRTINQLKERSPSLGEWPFLKRIAFTDEREFRLFLGVEDADPPEMFRIKMPLTSIDRIMLSPWLPESVVQSVKKVLQAIPGCGDLQIYRSSLVDNENWKRFATGRRHSSS